MFKWITNLYKKWADAREKRNAFQWEVPVAANLPLPEPTPVEPVFVIVHQQPHVPPSPMSDAEIVKAVNRAVRRAPQKTPAPKKARTIKK